MSQHPAAIGIIGGSGFYDLPGLTGARPIAIETPFGSPSEAPMVGRVADRPVVFIARHGGGHTLLPGEINARANIWALKALGVTTVISVSAVGSLTEDIAPGDVVLPDQFIDVTQGRPRTFFGDGVVAHVSLAQPVCARLTEALHGAADAAGQTRVRQGGTYVCIEGPQFSTRAESEVWRRLGGHVVGMTNLPEARLAREAELCYASLTLPTDYDCWRSAQEEVRVVDVLAVLRSNVEKARTIVAQALGSLSAETPCPCRTVLDVALVTPVEQMDARARERLRPLLARRLLAS